MFLPPHIVNIQNMLVKKRGGGGGVIGSRLDAEREREKKFKVSSIHK